MESYQLAKRISELALEKKGFDVKIIKLNGLSSSFDFFVVISGNVDQHLKAISEHIRKELSREGEKPLGYEGQSNAKWVLLDYVDVIVHIFDKENRGLYRLEKLFPTAEIEEVLDTAEETPELQQA